MKKLRPILLLVTVALGTHLTNTSASAQSFFGTTDTIIFNNSTKEALSATVAAPVQSVSITGNVKALIVPVGFPDKPATLQFPTLVNSQYFPVVGVDSNGTLLSDLISANGGSLPEDQWYGPGFNSFFTKESGGLFNVSFVFVKKADGTRYTTTDNYSHFEAEQGIDEDVIYGRYQEILNEVAQNMYAQNSSIFNGVSDINFTFEGISLCEFYNCDAAGISLGSITLRGTNGQVLWSGQASIQLDCSRVIHEFMHIIGLVVGSPSGFEGFPDRGYSPDVYDPNGSPNNNHGNMGFDYDLMDHNSALPSLHSLYGLRPLTSHDLIFLGWIKPDEILTVNSGNFTNYSDIKLADVNFPLTQQQISNGYYRIVKVMIRSNYDGNGHDEYFLVEYHNASQFDKTFENYDDYQNGGYNTGVLIWHVKEVVNMINLGSDNLVEIEPAAPYNDFYGEPIPNDNYPGHGIYNRPSLPSLSLPWWNGIYSGDFNYLDDERMDPNNTSEYVYFPDGGRHIWETTLSTKQGWAGWKAAEQSGTIVLAREQSMRSDFFSDANVKGQVNNTMTDVTRPSTKEWGIYNNGTPIANETHIAISNITRHSGNMSIRVYYNTFAGTVTQDTTITGDAVVAGNLTLNPGVTLTVASGATLTLLNKDTLFFGTDAALTVDGVLNAVGTSSQPITFTSTGSTTPGIWGSIILSGSGADGSTLKYCNIYYPTDVEVNNSSNVTIENCNIKNSAYTGINVYFSSYFLAQNDTIVNSNYNHGILITGGSSNNCYQNTIYKQSSGYHNGAGIEYSGSSGNVGQNDIDYYNWGIGAIWGASPTSYVPSWNGSQRNNRITNCIYGLMVYHQSYPSFGPIQTSPYSYNSIYGNTYSVSLDADNFNTYTLPAIGNYWNSTNPSSTFILGSGSQVSWSPVLSYNPWASFPLPAGSQQIVGGSVRLASQAAHGNAPGTDAQSSPAIANTQDTLMVGIDLRARGDLGGAEKHFMSYIKNHPNNPAAYVDLYGCADSSTLPGIIDLFKSSPAQAPHVCKLLLANLYQMEGQTDLAVQVDDSIIDGNPNTALEVRAEMNKMLIALYDKNNLRDAVALLSSIKAKSKLINPMELQDAEAAVASHSGVPVAGSQRITSVAGSTFPKSFGLSQNYPNPFNPTTVIQYQLPKDSHVTLKVYDVLGREVAILAEGNELAGTHAVTFDGSRFASGIYFYRLTTPGYSKTQKMILMK